MKHAWVIFESLESLDFYVCLLIVFYDIKRIGCLVKIINKVYAQKTRVGQEKENVPGLT